MTAEPGLPVTPHRQGSTVELTVSPRSSFNAIGRDGGGALRVRVTAPPVAGAANAAVLRLLADALQVPRSRLSIATGESGRRKRVLVTEMSAEMLIMRLEETLRRPG